MAKTECGLDDDAPISQAPAHAIPSVPLSALIYIETTFPSFYHETRPKPELVAMRNWTRDWWQQAAATNQFVTSDAVLAELDLTPEPKRTECHALTGTLPILEDLPEIDETVEFYIRHKLMPASLIGDARHLALAAWHSYDVLPREPLAQTLGRRPARATGFSTRRCERAKAAALYRQSPCRPAR